MAKANTISGQKAFSDQLSFPIHIHVVLAAPTEDVHTQLIQPYTLTGKTIYAAGE